ncbi:MAG: rhamnogalacturonan acetylesterase [Lachnospiraceae bacterium]|nr:rhamnogalacturonan acetylesterase [Lachnospiraceae bacterium]
MKPIIYWAGDSTVKQNDITSYPQTGIGQGFSLYAKKGIFIDNRAENGRSSKSFINEGILAAIEKDIKAGDFLFIQFGHNDEKPDEERHTEAFGSYQEYLKQYIKVARDKGAYPVLITSLYRRQFQADEKTLVPATHQNYPEAMIALAKECNVPVIDLCSLSKDLIEKSGPEVSKRWFMHLPAGRYPNYPENKADNSHLVYEGAVVFAGLIATELRKLGGIYEDILVPLDGEKENPALLID